jgi:hypothetical protein
MSTEYSPYAMTPAEERDVLPHSLTFTAKQVEAARAYLRADAEVAAIEGAYSATGRWPDSWEAYSTAVETHTRAGEALNTAVDHDYRLRDAILYYLEVVRGERY